MKNKKLISIILSVLLIGATFVLPLTANAVDSYSGTTLSVNWEQGHYNANNGIKSASTNTNIRSTTYIDVSSYDKIGVEYNVSVISWNVHFYDNNNNFISSAYPQTAYGNGTGTVDVAGPRMTISLYASPYITTSNGSLVTVKGIKMPAIDTTKTGSLTITKYEMNDVSTATNKGTGTTSDKSLADAAGTPLKGVTFKITKVAEVTSTYYTKDGVSLPTVVQASSMNAIGTPLTQTTNNNGIANFQNLPLGIYLVQETNTPNYVTKSVDDFVVSIPTTNEAGTGWNYNLSVYPKNETKYASVQIQKVDSSNTNTKLSGAIFSLAKSEDNSTFTWIEDLTTNTNGIATPTKSLPVNCYYRLRENTAPSKYIKDNASNNNDTYFYLDESGRILSRDKSTVLNAPSSGNPAVITIKNSKPTINKYIIDSVNLSTPSASAVTVDSIRRRDDSNNYQVYLFKVVTPNISSAMSSLKTFELSDTLTNIDGAKVAPQVLKITYGSNATDANANILSTDAYTFTATQNSSTNTTYNTKLSFDTSKISKNTIYFIYYKVYVKGETTNKATLKYSTVTSGTDTTAEIDSNTVTFISGQATLKKQSNSGTALAGAEFQLFTSEKDAIAKKNPIYATSNRNLSLTNNTFVSASDGVVNIFDIDLGSKNANATKDYWLVETKAPNGYNLLAVPYKITVSRNGIVGNESGLVIKNSKTTTFPLTGGHGWIMFAIGAVVFFGCGTVLIIKKKKNKKGAIEHES